MPAADIDALFRLTPEKFTAARNNLAAHLKDAGQPDEAAHVRGLSKPPVSAWVVNQLFWRHRRPFARLMTAGAGLRKAQTSQLRGKGGDLRGPLEARRQALGELSKEAATLLRGAGHAASPDLMRKVTTTLEALAAYANHPSAPRAGRLTADLDAPGFEALAALIPRQPAQAGGKRRDEPSRVIPFARKQAPARPKNPEARKKQEEADRKARLAAAAAAIQAAERSLAAARKAAARAEAALRKAAARTKEAEREKEAVGARYEKLTADADKARQAARKVAAVAEDAAQAVEDAERALEQARETKATLALGE